MKILQINTVVNSGSTGRIIEDIGSEIIKNGDQSFVAFGRNERPSTSEIIRIGTSWDNNLHALQTRVLDNHGFASRRATKIFVKQIELLKPNLIHLHNLHGYYLNVELLFTYLASAKIPVVWTLHDCWPFTGHCTHFTYVRCNRWKTECFDCPQKSEYPKSIFFDNARKNFSKKKQLFSNLPDLTIVTVSDWLKSIVSDSFMGHLPISKIYNGINTNKFKCDYDLSLLDKFSLKNKFILLGVAGAWNNRKGFNDYKALSEILHEDEVMVLIGVNDKQRNQLPNNVIGIKRTEDLDELIKWYSVADVVLNLSYEETFGMTTIEGLACGTPAIVYNSTASPELITEKTGVIVKSGNYGELRNAINKIKHSGKHYYYANCVELAKSRYDKSIMTDAYIKLYQKLIK